MVHRNDGSPRRGERRAAPRSTTHIYFNKYIDGHPYLCEALEVSSTGMLVRRIHAPDVERAFYAVEMAGGPLLRGEDRAWLCATPVWTAGDLEALRFVECSDGDHALLAGILAAIAA
jgi:hypothetical protein